MYIQQISVHNLGFKLWNTPLSSLRMASWLVRLSQNKNFMKHKKVKN